MTKVKVKCDIVKVKGGKSESWQKNGLNQNDEI